MFALSLQLPYAVLQPGTKQVIIVVNYVNFPIDRLQMDVVG